MKEKISKPDFYDSGKLPTSKKNRVMGIIQNMRDVEDAIDELYDTGFQEDLVVFSGQEAVEKVDLSGSRHGILGRVVRTMQQLGEDYTQFQRYEQAWLDGYYTVSIPANSPEETEQIKMILEKHQAYELVFFGNLIIEKL